MGRGGVSVGVGVGGAYGRVLVASVARSAMAFSYSWHLIKCPATNERFCDPPPGRTKCFRSIGMTTQADGGIPVSNEHHPVDYWDVEALLLDDENPRLPVSQGLRSQDEILLLIAKTYTIGELMESFAINGYFDEEPLVGVPFSDDPTKLIIVEGNRRLSALKLLLEPQLVKRLVDPSNGRPIRIVVPALTRDRRQELKSVPVRVYEEGRSAVLAYMGYRHITGVKTWNSYAKARYVHQLVEDGNELKDIQKRIGDRHETAPRLLRAYLVWEQANSLAMIPARNGHAPNFSYLFTALTFRPMLQFLGLAAQGMPRRVRRKKISQLEEVVTYLYGTVDGGRKPAIKESREIKDLAQAVASNRALEKLREGASVSEAVEVIPVAEARLEKLIRQALDRLNQAAEIAHSGKGNEQVQELAADCLDASQRLVKAVK